MAGNNVRRNFVGDVRPCASCGMEITVTEQMAKRSKYRCSPCNVRQAMDWVERNRDKKRAANNAYSACRSSSRARQTSAYRASHPEKKAAHQAVQSALRNGSLTKKPCEVCGSEVRIHGHHDDYSKPLDVVWLCHSHHMARHHAMLEARTK